VSETSRRLDVELVRRGLARSRGQARELVDSGLVLLDGQVAGKPAIPVAEGQDLSVTGSAQTWVSRAAYKLLAALEAFGPAGLQVEGRRCIDVGASTGGFTQVLLRHGAQHVVALDVGHGQLVPEVADDPRVTERSGVNVRGVQPDDLGGPADLVVADLSFISLQVVLGVLATLTTGDGDLVVLVKPQFEVGRERLGHGGVVRSASERARSIVEVATVAETSGLHPRGLRPSPIRGTTGNVEYLLWLTPRAGEGLAPDRIAAMAAELTAEGTA
jgi:23S rRNA (cytidine1920-2'-O)/16S rRNA (cytidine1409-2'-O)-methyltransferase